DNFEVDVKTSSQYRDKMLVADHLEKLSVEAAQNPVLAEWLNMDEITQIRLSALNIPFKQAIRTPEEVAAARQQAAEQPDPEMLKLQLQQKELEIKEREVAIKEKMAAIEAQHKMQMAQMEHEQAMISGWARGNE